MSPLILPFRCSICDRREYKFRFIDMNPGARKYEDEVVIEMSKPKAPKAPVPQSPPAQVSEEAPAGESEQPKIAEKN